MWFSCADPMLKRELALKVLRPEALLSSEMRRRFLRKGQAAARLQHANILPVFEAGEADGVSYIAQAFCDGITLADGFSRQPAGVAQHRRQDRR